MKRFTQIIALLFAVLSLQAQKIDTRLTSLLPTDNMPMSIGGASASGLVPSRETSIHHFR